MLLEARRTLMRNMLPTCTSPKPMRTFSPAISEISVGSPSPPPTKSALRIAPLSSLRNPSAGFQPPIQVKRLRTLTNAGRAPSPKDLKLSNISLPQTDRKSGVERVKSFKIDDILGRKTDSNAEKNPSPHEKQTEATVLQSPIPSERFQSYPNITLPPLHGLAPMILEVPATTLTKPVLTPWDPTALQGPLPTSPFFSPAHLLHYEQRLAWDYQRQLQEHFQLQAQMLRQMSMDPNVIQSEDGSERDSRSRNSTGSACCSPEVNVNSNDSVSESPEKSTKEASRAESGENRGKNTSDERSSGDKNKKSIGGDTPLDALFQLSTKNFDEEQDPTTLNIFATRPNPKKKRKSRTAFTNHQIFELEKRFLYQKYLSPADRDEIASGLGLSNAQVITWFQNRRAKLKRDMEELKKDVESVKKLSGHKSFLENVNDLSILKTRPVSRHQTSPAAIAATTTTGSIIHPNSKQPAYRIMATTPPIHNHSPYGIDNDDIGAEQNRSNYDDVRETSNQQPRTQQHNMRG